MQSVTISFMMWVVPFDLWRIRKTIRQQESRGLHLTEVVPPSLFHQRLSLRFAERDTVSPTNVRFVFGWRLAKFEGYKILSTVKNDAAGIPFGYYYFFEQHMA
jgi:hypothetical protein